MSTDDRTIDRTWRSATIAAATLFVVQVVLLVSLRGIDEPDYGAIPTEGYFIVSGVSLFLTLLVTRVISVSKGIVLATSVTTALWAAASVVIALLSWGGGG